MNRQTYTKSILKQFLNLIQNKGIIEETPPDFFTDCFREKTVKLNDDFIKKHSLEIIDNGYTVIRNSTDENLINTAVNEFKLWKNRNNPHFLNEFYKFNNRLDRIINLHSRLNIFQELFTSNSSLKIMDYLFMKDTCLYTSLFFEVGSTQDTHRDIPLFWTNPAYMYFGTWLALEDVDSENGPLVVYPGSHKLPLFDRNSFLKKIGRNSNDVKDIDEELWKEYQDFCSQESARKGFVLREVHVKKGDTIIWHPLLVHGGKEIINKSRTRLSFVAHVTPYNTPVFHMNIFFNKQSVVPKNAPWKYHMLNNRYIMNSSLGINHVSDFDYTKLI
jgi:ectoine hydroxylase-related dioxygenase (phytanoyl-CoA dioxygenase family)